jgi:hypothetical protein
MLSSFSKLISNPRLSLFFLKQQYSFASTSSSKGDTRQNGKKDEHQPTIDASHQSGTKSEKERIEWENKEQGFSSDTKIRQERIPQDQKKNVKTKTSNK